MEQYANTRMIKRVVRNVISFRKMYQKLYYMDIPADIFLTIKYEWGDLNSKDIPTILVSLAPAWWAYKYPRDYDP